ncbi:MAG: hypothetical protein GY792_03860, partial [Gammaproteobacteria bacterium]|nr:hypothetical protein [Gammaproteobacteria bacterium]
VLKDGSLPTVWEEYRSLLLLCQEENQLHHNWGERRQHFQWVNQIRYEFGANGKNHIDLNLVLCHEQWEEVDPKTLEIVPKKMKYAWISSRPISRLNVHTRCNLGARYRWGIEAGSLVEKHDLHGCTNAAVARMPKSGLGLFLRTCLCQKLECHESAPPRSAASSKSNLRRI